MVRPNTDRAGGDSRPLVMKKYKVIVPWVPVGSMKAYKLGEVMTPQPNVARMLMDRGLIEPIEDEMEFAEIETASMDLADAESPREPVKRKRKRKKRAVHQ